MLSAIDDPIIARISGAQFWSTDKSEATTCTSFLNPSGNRGLIGLSIKRSVNIAFSDGRLFLFMYPPGILPTEYNFSWYSTLNGKKSIPSLEDFDVQAVTSNTVSPYFNQAAPFACSATLPTSTSSVLPAISVLKLFIMFSSFKSFLFIVILKFY